MTEKTFWNQWKGVNAPEYRGAPYPEFDPAKINESRICDELRYKDYEIDFIEGDASHADLVRVTWISQSWDDSGVDSVVDEISRCLSYLGFTGNVELDIWERGCQGEDESDFRTFYVNG